MLVEARAMGVDVEAATAHPFRTMLKLDLIASSLGIALFLFFYYASVSVLTIYWVVVFNRSTPDADGINVWYAGVLSGTLVIFGVVSDKLRVRKPLMLVGAAGSIVMMIFVINQIDHPHTGYYSNVVVIALLATAIGCAYCPWMAGYTEQVESHNPALAASGLAVWGWILRIVVAVSFLVLPHVITTATTLVDNYAAGSELQALQTAQPYVPSLAAGAKPPASAPASVITQLESIHEPGTNALAQILRDYPETHRSSLVELQAFAAAQPYVPTGSSVAAARARCGSRAVERHRRERAASARSDTPGLCGDPQPGCGCNEDSSLARRAARSASSRELQPAGVGDPGRQTRHERRDRQGRRSEPADRCSTTSCCSCRPEPRRPPFCDSNLWLRRCRQASR